MNADARGPERNSSFVAALAECLSVLVKRQRAGDGTVSMIGLLSRGAKQHVQRITHDLRHRAVMSKNDIRHAGEVLIEQRAENARFQRLRERGEAGDVREQCGDLPTLPAQIDGVFVTGKPLRQIRRKIARQQFIGALGGGLAVPRVTQKLDVSNRLGDGRLQIKEVDRLGHEVKRAAVHSGTDIGHIAVGRNDDSRHTFLALLQLLQQRQPIHPRHIDVGDDQVDTAVRLERRQRFDAIAREHEADRSVPDLTPELLQDERLHVRLVVDHKYMRAMRHVRPAFRSHREATQSLSVWSAALQHRLPRPCAPSRHLRTR